MSIPSAPVAVLGLGVIGAGMAENLRAAGLDLCVWNRGAARTERFRDGTTMIATTPREAAARSQVILVAVTDDAALRGVTIGDQGILAGARPGAVVVNCCTVDPRTDVDLAALASTGGVGWIDAPVTGGAEAAESGTLTLLCGGEEAPFVQARPVLDVVSRAAHHMGPTGSGQWTKAVNGVMLAGSLLGVAEGIALARAAGLDLEQVVDALQHGAAASWVLSQRASFMVQGTFPPAGRMALQLKDLHIAVQAADQLGLELRGAATVAELEAQLVADGHGDEDISALVRAYAPRGLS